MGMNEEHMVLGPYKTEPFRYERQWCTMAETKFNNKDVSRSGWGNSNKCHGVYAEPTTTALVQEACSGEVKQMKMEPKISPDAVRESKPIVQYELPSMHALLDQQASTCKKNGLFGEAAIFSRYARLIGALIRDLSDGSPDNPEGRRDVLQDTRDLLDNSDEKDVKQFLA